MCKIFYTMPYIYAIKNLINDKMYVGSTKSIKRRKYHHFYQAGQQSQQAKIDELQARIDKTVNHIEEWYGCVELSNIVDMLKGNKDEN